MRPAALVAMAAAVTAVSGCGSGPASSSSPAPAAPGLSPAMRREAVRPDPAFDFGLTIQITAEGARPRQLVAPCCDGITWVNRTGTTTSVVFDHQLVSSGPIPPGGTFVFHPHNIESVTYHSDIDPSLRGAVQVNPTEQ